MAGAVVADMTTRYSTWAIEERKQTGSNPRWWVESLGWLRVVEMYEAGGEAAWSRAFAAWRAPKLF